MLKKSKGALGFWRKEGGKQVFNLKRLLVISATIAIVIILGYLSYLIVGNGKGADTSRIRKNAAPLVEAENVKRAVDSQGNSQVGGVSGQRQRNHEKRPLQRPAKKITYYAKQVLVSEDAFEGSRFPLGTHLIGKLLSGLDTRSKQRVKAILPFDSKVRRGKGNLPAGTVFLGAVSYSGSGNKVFIQFDRGIFPSGKEFSLKAQALSTEDYSLGIKGTFHSNRGRRAAAVLGLSLLSGVSETLVEKEALGQGFHITPKASVKNGLYKGMAEVANREGQRAAARPHQAPEYVTVEAGKDIIISLTGSLRGGND